MNNNIQRIISEYSKSIIQSEAEVRSKLIVPLLEILGYPSYLRAEEFPVYGFGGGKKLPAKNADYILFSDRQFANHRMFTKKNIEWVQKHSLLVVEAKKPRRNAGDTWPARILCYVDKSYRLSCYRWSSY